MLGVLVNNACMSDGMPQFTTTPNIDMLHEVFNVNLYGAVRTMQVFIDLLRNVPQPGIVNVSECALIA